MRGDSPSDTESQYPWRIFWALLLAAVLGGLAALPYILAIFGDKLRRVGGSPVDLPVIVVTNVLQITLVFGLIVGVGLLIAPKVGIGTPLLRSWFYGERPEPEQVKFGRPIVAGLALGLITAGGIYGLMGPRVPGWPSEAGLPIWMRLLACFYGAVDEELLMRLFLLGLILWVLLKVKGGRERPTPALFWVANVIAAILFGLAYLPAASSLVSLTWFVVVPIVAVKALCGLYYGYVCWSRGLEAAMVAHFMSDLVAHFLGPVIGG